MAQRDTLRGRIQQYMGSVFAEAQFNEAINAAIEAAWPAIQDADTDASITVTDDTYAYTPAAANITEKGIAQVWVVRDDAADVLLRRARQEQVDGQWRIYLTSDQVSRWEGHTLRLVYNCKHERLEDDTTETNVPSLYIIFFANSVLSIVAQTEEDHFDTERYQAAAAQWYELAQQELEKGRTGGLKYYIGMGTP